MPQPTKHAIRNVVSAFASTVWAIEESTFTAMVELLQTRSDGFEFTEDEVRERIESRARLRSAEDDEEYDGPRRVGSVAILPLQGVLAPRMSIFQRISGGTSTQEFASWYRQAMNDPNVGAIVLDVDSPGGAAQGNEEVAQVIRENRGKKPVKAVVTGLGASAAYHVASAADEIVLTKSSEVGSVGVFMIHGESSKADAAAGRTYTVVKAGENKAAGNSVEPLTDKSRAVLQERVDGFYSQFVAAVAANRGVSAADVEKNFGQGKVMISDAAIAAGLADRVGSLAEVVAELNKSLGGDEPSRRAAASTLDATEGVSMKLDKTVVSLMAACGLVAADASETDSLAALRTFFVLKGKTLPDAASEQLAALQAHKKEIDGVGDRQLVDAQAKGAKLERERIEDLTARAGILGVSEEDLQAAIKDGSSIDAAIKAWTGPESKLAKEKASVSNDRNNVSLKGSQDDKFAAAAAEALLHRAGYGQGEPSQAAKELRHAKLLQLAEKSLALSGIRTAGMDDEDIARAALRGNGEEIRVGALYAGSPSARPGDFPNLLASLAGKMLEPVPEYAGATFREWATPIASVSDFKPKTLIATGEFGEFPIVPDGDDFEDGTTPGEEASWISVDRFGDEWKLTPVMMANDDLDGFTDAVTDKNAAHDLTLNRLCVNLLTGNITLPDGNALFDDTNHGNDVTSGGAPSQTELSKVRLKLRKQTGVSDKRKLNQKLGHVLVPEDLETTTEQLLANLQVVPVTDSTINTFRQKVTFSVEPMLGEASAVQWYGFAPPKLGRAIVYAYMRGFERMKVTTYWDPKSGCRVWQFEGRMAAAARNYRGVVRNAGA